MSIRRITEFPALAPTFQLLMRQTIVVRGRTRSLSCEWCGCYCSTVVAGLPLQPILHPARLIISRPR